MEFFTISTATECTEIEASQIERAELPETDYSLVCYPADGGLFVAGSIKLYGGEAVKDVRYKIEGNKLILECDVFQPGERTQAVTYEAIYFKIKGLSKKDYTCEGYGSIEIRKI